MAESNTITVEVPGLGVIPFPKGTPAPVIEATIAENYKKAELNIPNSPYVKMITDEAKRQGVDPHLALRMAHQESRFDPNAVSNRGATGLFQLMPGTAKEMGVTDATDPAQNIRGGIGYLAKLIKARGGDVNQALAAYNWGGGNLDKYGIEKAPPETQDYIRRLTLAGLNGPGSIAAAGAGQGSAAPTPSAPDPSLTALPPPQRQQLQTLKQTGEQMGEELDPLSKLGVGAVNSFNRTARAIGLHRALRAAGMKLDDPDKTGEVMGGMASTGPGLVGDLAGTGVQIAAAAPLARFLPQSLARFAANNPTTATALGAGGSTAVMTPGDIGERAKEGSIATLLGGTLAKTLSKFVKPAELEKNAETFYKATGELPPLHVGAESQLLRDVGDMAKGIPFIGPKLKEAEERMMGAGAKQLWQNATPPGAANLMAAGQPLERGKIFQDLRQQYDDAYDRLLKGQHVPVGNADRATITKLIDRSLTPDDAAVVHQVINQYFPTHSGKIGGATWKELQSIIRENAANFGSSGAVMERKIGEVFNQIDQHLIKMRNKGVSAQIARELDHTDRAYGNGQLLKEAITKAGGESGITPKMLATALRQRASTNALAEGTASGQQIIDPLAATLGSVKEPSVSSAIIGLRRLALPTAAGGIIGGIPGAAAVPTATVLANLIGSTKKGAEIMFGKTGLQKKLADLLRSNPNALEQGASNATLQGTE